MVHLPYLLYRLFIQMLQFTICWSHLKTTGTLLPPTDSMTYQSFCSRNIPGSAEPTDTFQIWILRPRDSLSWLAERRTVEERTPFHMVSRNGALERATIFRTVISSFGDIAWSARSPEFTVPDFFLWGVSERPCVPEAYHDYLINQTSHCWRRCDYWWRPTEARERQLPDTLATVYWCKRRPSAWWNFQKISL